GIAGDPQRFRPTNAQSVDNGPYVFPAVADNPTLFMDSLGTSQCAKWAQLVAIGLNQPLGPASNWIAGPQVMTDPSMKPGTVIGSGFNKKGRYPNRDEGNHIGFFLGFIPGGFRMFENVHGTVQPRDVKDPNGGYFRNPNYYYAIMVPTT